MCCSGSHYVFTEDQTGARDISVDILTNQFGLYQTITLIPIDFTMWLIFGVSVSCILYSSMSDLKETDDIEFEQRGVEEVMHFSREKIKCYDESKWRPF